MRDQIRHLAEQAEKPRYSLRVAPAKDGRVPHIYGSLTLFKFEHSHLPEAAYLESEMGPSFVTDGRDVEALDKRFSAFSQTSFSRERTRSYLRDLAARYS